MLHLASLTQVHLITDDLSTVPDLSKLKKNINFANLDYTGPIKISIHWLESVFTRNINIEFNRADR